MFSLLGCALVAASLTPSAAHAQAAPASATPEAASAQPAAPAGATLLGGDTGSGSNASAYGARVRPPRQVEEPLLLDRNPSWALGWRAWFTHVPSGIVSLFAHIESGWPGGLNVATGPEFVYRTSSLEIQLAAMFVGYNAPPAYFRGQSDPENATEEIRSSLFGVYATSTFMYPIRFHRMIELQIGAGIGVGGIGGQLTRGQAFRYPNGASNDWFNCQTPEGRPVQPNGMQVMTRDGRVVTDVMGDCMTDNQRYSGPPDANGNFTMQRAGYVEGNWATGGNVPLVLPWLSIPQVSLHVRPHRNFDLRIDGGYMLIGYYVGGAIHVVL